MNLRSDVRFFAVGFFVLAVLLRITPHAYNLAAVGALGMFVGCFWSARIGLLMSVAAMAVSDGLGHWLGIASMGSYETWLMLAVYAAIACAAGVGKLISRARDKAQVPMLAAVPLGAIASAAIFFVITNFACWLDPRMGYPTNLVGLAECYAAAIPFAKNTLIGNLVYSGLFFGAYGVLTAPSAARSSAK